MLSPDGADKATSDEVVIPTGEIQIFSLPGDVKLEMVFIPAGTFWMGSPSGETGKLADEHRHQVTLSKGFQIGKYPITQAQWLAVMGKNPSEFKERGMECPVEQISWNNCQAFIKKLNELEPEGRFRLPTEAEWEYACRAGTEGERYGGSNLGEIAWYGDSNRFGGTHPVGQLKPNSWGLYDMLGNVDEWCSDLYENPGYDSYPSGVFNIDPKGPNTSSYIIQRGGSWSSKARECRPAYRFGIYGPSDTKGAGEPGEARSSFGFRLVRTL
jgi:formylglycine-generating enzyme required for sulfatase activity